MKKQRVHEVTVEGQQSFKSVPAGEYQVRFLYAEEAEGHAEFGPAFRWVFEVDEGPHTGVRVSTLTGQKFSQSTSAGKLLSQLLGCPLSSGRVDLRELEGRRFQALVVVAGNGTKVSDVRPLKPSVENLAGDAAEDVPF